MFLQGNFIYMKFNFRKKRSRRPYCQYSETEAHQSFVSRGIELYLKYGCGTPSEMIYHRRNTMYYLWLNHRHRIDQWHHETDPHVDIKWSSVWDLHTEWIGSAWYLYLLKFLRIMSLRLSWPPYNNHHSMTSLCRDIPLRHQRVNGHILHI